MDKILDIMPITIAIILLAIGQIMQDRVIIQQQKKIDALWEFPKEPQELQQPDEECRCKTCKTKTNCPAYDTGVCFPCPHFEEE